MLCMRLTCLLTWWSVGAPNVLRSWAISKAIFHIHFIMSAYLIATLRLIDLLAITLYLSSVYLNLGLNKVIICGKCNNN